MAEFDHPADALRFGCPGCGSGLRYDIGLGKMYCDSCQRTYDLSQIDDPSRQAADGLMDAAEYRCPQCGARLRMPRGLGEKTVTCSRCGRSFRKKA